MNTKWKALMDEASAKIGEAVSTMPDEAAKVLDEIRSFSGIEVTLKIIDDQIELFDGDKQAHYLYSVGLYSMIRAAMALGESER